MPSWAMLAAASQETVAESLRWEMSYSRKEVEEAPRVKSQSGRLVPFFISGGFATIGHFT